MSVERTSCVYRGNTFFGQFDRIDGPDGQIIRVRFRGAERQAALSGALAEVVAHRLFRDLVIRDCVRIRAAEARLASDPSRAAAPGEPFQHGAAPAPPTDAPASP